MAGKKVVYPCARCNKESAVIAKGKDGREIYLCAKHLPEHEEGLKKQNFVLTDL